MLKLNMNDDDSTVLYIELYDGVSISKARCGSEYSIDITFQVCSPTEKLKKVRLGYYCSPTRRDDDYNMIISEIDKYLHPPIGLNDAALPPICKIPEKSEEKEEIYCTECPDFEDIVEDGRSWFGALCKKDGHESAPSMYAIQCLHNDCPLKKKESEEK